MSGYPTYQEVTATRGIFSRAPRAGYNASAMSSLIPNSAFAPNFVVIAVGLLAQAPANWSQPWPLGDLLFGMLIFVVAVVGTFTGKVYGKGGRADRAEQPFTYWLTLIVEYLAAVFFIAYWLFSLPH